ncbi:uncharacterized protein ABDE67_005291 [Symphorus nematophorus]
MALLLLLAMLTACAAVPKDLSGKMFTFPQQTNTAHVRLTTSRQVLRAATVCLRSFTDLRRDHTPFSLATPSIFNDFLIYVATNNVIHLGIRNHDVTFAEQDYKLNRWLSICATWDSASGLGQLWLDGKPSSRKFLISGANISGPIIIVLGQEQDSYGGAFDINQSFVGMMSDVHMWDYTLSPCEIEDYVQNIDLTQGNMLNWKALEFQIIGRVLVEDKDRNIRSELQASPLSLQDLINSVHDIQCKIEDIKMALLLLLVMLTACAASPRDLSGKMFTFPEETKTANVRLTTSRQDINALTVCFSSITDLSRDYTLFSLATQSIDNAFLIFIHKVAARNVIQLYVRNKNADFGGQDYKLNMWHSICATWDSVSGLVQLWIDAKPSIRKFTGGSNITRPIVILGQEQDSYGGGFDIKQSFVGMMSDVHMWDYVLSPCEIQHYVNDLNFTPGNVLNWRALQFQTTGRVLIERKQLTCNQG